MNFESLHNYYEQLVTESIMDKFGHMAESSPELLEDIACVALNQLPARYIRHNVDFIFYMSPEERAAMQKQVEKAVKDASNLVLAKNKKKD